MSVKAVLKMINVFLGLGAFLAVGAMSLAAGEELIWAVGKAIAVFMACWVILGWFAGLLSNSVEETRNIPEDPDAQSEKGKNARA